MTGRYTKCPKCQLNYITQSMTCCTLCASPSKDDNIYDEVIVCPFCFKNTMGVDDIMCVQCSMKRNKCDC